ncbi:MAG: hypothetical protein AMXMBFR64_01100 [Myxococcales bacterium]
MAHPDWLRALLVCSACRAPWNGEAPCPCGQARPDPVQAGLGAEYDGLLDGALWKAARDPRRFEAIDAPLLEAAGPTTLELGCGFGRLLDLLAPRVERLVGVDLSARSLAVAAGRGHTVLRADALALPFRAGAFDAVVAGFGVFAHLEPRAAIAEAARVLAPGGRLAFHTFGRYALDVSRVAGAVVRLRLPPPRTSFHAHALRTLAPVDAALAAAGLWRTHLDCHLHAPGIKRLLRRRPVVHVAALAPWSWDVVVVAQKG